VVIIFSRKLEEKEREFLLRELKQQGVQPHLVEGEKTILVAKASFPVMESFSDLPIERVVTVDTPFPLTHRSFYPTGTLIQIGEVKIAPDVITVIAGPCAVESETQILQAAEIVKRAGAHLLRGGAFKPRTSPYSFQGLGEKGLELLAKAGEQFDLPIVTEATSPENASLVAAYADVIQIGARNMQNFELLKKVGQLKQPVILKRGMSATIEDWLLAAEYILSFGNFQVILCERGIRTIERFTRNTLDLTSIPVVKDLSHLPVLVDPSHGTGLREKVVPMSRAAIACGADGVMVEVHPQPDQALSDGPQSLYPDQFKKLMSDLEVVGILVGKELKREKPLELFTPDGEQKEFKPPKVAFLGKEGSFSSQVVRRSFGQEVEQVPSLTFREIFEKVSMGEVTYGVVPIENTITGSIHNNYDLLLEFSSIYLVGERFIRVSQHLGIFPETKKEEIQVVFAHPQGFAQCSRFLESLQGVRIMDVGNTEEAARRAWEFGQGGACISSEEAITRYGLSMAEEEIEDNPRNFTRFIIISTRFEPVTDHDKVSCVYSVENRPGALFETLQLFAENQINLLKLESRPFPGKPWEYMFYLDWEGNLVEPEFKTVLAELSKRTVFLRVLGSYRNRWRQPTT